MGMPMSMDLLLSLIRVAIFLVLSKKKKKIFFVSIS